MMILRRTLWWFLVLALAGTVPASPGFLEVIHPPDGSAMIVIPATEFWMGSRETHPDLPPELPGNNPLFPEQVLLVRAFPAWSQADERPAHRVILPTFAIDRYEVTNGQYARFLKEADHGKCHPDEPADKDHTPRYWGDYNPLLRDPGYARTAPFGPDTFRGENSPVVGVDWFDAYAYAAWAGKRLPSEAEWELGARGTDRRRWPWGNDWEWGRANIGGERLGRDIPARGFDRDGFIYPAPVGSFPGGRSPAGCDDMAGNVAEWCADGYRENAYSLEAPLGSSRGRHRVVRGGSSRSNPSGVRCAARDHREPGFRSFVIGFRCARDE